MFPAARTFAADAAKDRTPPLFGRAPRRRDRFAGQIMKA